MFPLMPYVQSAHIPSLRGTFTADQEAATKKLAELGCCSIDVLYRHFRPKKQEASVTPAHVPAPVA